MGLTAIDLLEEAEWPVARQHGLVCSMGYAGGGSIRDGLNVKANHDAIVKNFEQTIPRAAAMKVPNVITFFGNRRGMSDEEAIANCVAGLNRVKKIAEDHGVTICVELLNSKVESRGLSRRPHRVRRRDRQGGRLAAREAPVRHLPHADHGGRPRPHHPRSAAVSSGTTTRAASPAVTSSTRRRRSTGRLSAAPSSTLASRATWRTSSCRPAIRSPRCERR